MADLQGRPRKQIVAGERFDSGFEMVSPDIHSMASVLVRFCSRKPFKCIISVVLGGDSLA